jgi:hypothetical protein
MHPGVKHEALLEGRAQRPVQAVLQLEVPSPLHHVGEQVAEEGRVLVEQRRELEDVLGGHELVQANLSWWE